jgi:hypothetical protein
MKVLVATCLGQGRKAHDVCTTLEGELVALPPTDHVCFLHQRVVSGLSSGGETTTSWWSIGLSSTVTSTAPPSTMV